MRPFFAAAVPLLFSVALLGSVPVVAQPGDRSSSTEDAAERNEAGWADWEAQARITDGDYDGAVQAERQADADRREAATQEARAPDR